VHKVKRVHMVGIGGAGMCGIAEVLHNMGFAVSGSDLKESASVRHLGELGVNIHLGHAVKNVANPHVLVKSTAIPDDNLEVIEARAKGIPVIPRAEMLAEISRLRSSIFIGGTHGKTTTTAITATIMEEAGLDPTVIIGGRFNAYGTNARLGSGDYLVAEADESDGSFLCLFPIMNVITNIDADHLDFYGDQEHIDQAFVDFMNKVPFYGLNVICGDDPGLRRVLPRIKRPTLTYGFSPENDLAAEVINSGPASRFRARLKNASLGEFSLPQPGRHNILNALGAIGVSLQVDIPAETCRRALNRFKGVGRRFELKGEREGIILVDDYAHHPNEIRATLETARLTYPDRRLVAAFQPHRFTRTKDQFGEFCQILSKVDLLLLTEIYAASETPIPGVTGQGLAQGVMQVSATPALFFRTLEEMSAGLTDILQPKDLLLTMGAGNIWTVGQRWLEGK